LRYFRRSKAKLYRQWVEQAGLPPETLRPEANKPGDVTREIDYPEAVSPVPDNLPVIHIRTDNQVATHPEVTGDMMAEINKRQPRLRTLHILLGVSLVVLCVVLVLLAIHSC